MLKWKSPGSSSLAKNWTFVMKRMLGRRLNDFYADNLLMLHSRNANAEIQCPVDQGEYTVTQSVPLPAVIPQGQCFSSFPSFIRHQLSDSPIYHPCRRNNSQCRAFIMFGSECWLQVLPHQIVYVMDAWTLIFFGLAFYFWTTDSLEWPHHVLKYNIRMHHIYIYAIPRPLNVRVSPALEE